MLKNILYFVLMLMICPMAFGQSVEYHGVFVGINDYPGTANDLEWDIADVQQMSYRLRDYQKWLSVNMTLLTDAQAYKSNILSTISAMPRNSGYTDLFHYSGHGDYSGIWVVNEVDLTQSDLQSAFGSSYNQYAAYLDACHSGIFPRDMTKGVISSACTVDELASEDDYLQHSTFSYYLIQGLTNNTAGGSDHLTSAEELHNYAAPLTTSYDPYMHPQLKDNYSGDLVLNLDIYVPQHYSTIASALSAAVSGQTVIVTNSQTLSGIVTVPTGVALILKSGSSINLNGFYIVTTSGTITVEGNVYILCTVLTQSGVIKGLFPTIQSAVNYSSSGQTVALQSRTYNESFAFNSKSGIYISGAGIDNTTINGSVNFSSSQNCTLANLTVTNNISLNYGSNYNYLNTLKVIGNIQPNMGSYSEIDNVDLTTSNYIGIVAGYSHPGVMNSLIQNKSVEGIYATGVTMIASFSTLCTNGPSGNRLDVLSSCGSPDIYLHGCRFSSSVEGSTVSGSYIHWDYWAYCGGLSKSVANADKVLSPQIKELPSALEGLSEQKDLVGEGDYENVIVNYRALFDRIRKENDGKMIDFKQYEKELTGIVSQFKDVMNKYPGSVSSVQSLQEVISCCRLLQNQQSAKQIVNNLLADITYQQVYPHIQLLSIPLLIDDQNYDGALSLCDTVISEIPNKSEAALLLYNKGIIFETLKNDTTNAKKTYDELRAQYPNSIYAFLVDQSLGKEITPKKSIEVPKIEKYELNSYPNPFNPTTEIRFTLPEAGCISLRIFDILGREVQALADGKYGAGSYSFTWNAGKNASGIYFVRLMVKDVLGNLKYSNLQKLMLTK